MGACVDVCVVGEEGVGSGAGCGGSLHEGVATWHEGEELPAARWLCGVCVCVRVLPGG